MKDSAFTECIKLFVVSCAAMLSAITAYPREITLADSLVADTTFVLRGEMSKSWRNKDLKFAVTDPVKNEVYEIISGKGRFDMTVPMRGYRQDVYLYIDGTVTIPVCAGDTINLCIGEDDMSLSASAPQANLDLQLAHVLHRKMRQSYMEINRTYNDYYTSLIQSPIKSDSLYSDLVVRIAEYQQRHKNVVDTFVAHNGSPRSEEYFRVSGYFRPMKFLVYTNRMQHTVSGFVSDDRPTVTYADYSDSWLMYPDYQRYAIDYLHSAADRACNTFCNPGDVDTFLKDSQLMRLIAPSELLADMADMYYIHAVMRFSGPEYGKAYVGPIYNACKSPAIREIIAQLSPDIERVSPGMQAPALEMYDINGNRFTLDDFKGKYVYLDFWDFGCAPCIREFAVMPIFKKHFADILDRVEFITVCASHPSAKQFSDFTHKHSMDDRNLIFDRNQSDKCYDQGLFPFYILIDPEGRIIEFNTARPSQILHQSKDGGASLFEKSVRNRI